MPMTPGYYMPQTPYLNTQSYAQMPQAYPQMPTAPNAQGMIWVDGEIGAKAFQMYLRELALGLVDLFGHRAVGY